MEGFTRTEPPLSRDVQRDVKIPLKINDYYEHMYLNLPVGCKTRLAMSLDGKGDVQVTQSSAVKCKQYKIVARSHLVSCQVGYCPATRCP